MLPNQKSISLSKQFTTAIITLTQMHTTIFVRFLQWARRVGHLSCPFAIFLLNHSLFPPKRCTAVFKPAIIDQLLDFLLEAFIFHRKFLSSFLLILTQI